MHAADLPFVGLVMMACGMFFQTVARLSTQQRGSAILMALVASFIKILMVGGIAVATVAAILIQSSIIELIYRYPVPSRRRVSFAGATGISYSLFHPFISLPLFMGLSIQDAFDRITSAGSVLLAIPEKSGFVIWIALLMIHFVVGWVVTFCCYNFAAKLNQLGLFPNFQLHTRSE